MTTKLSKWAPARPIVATHRNARYQRIIHRWLAHWIPSGRQTSNLAIIVDYKSLRWWPLYFCDFCIFAFFAKVLDFEGLSMETFIRLWPILNIDSPRASNELTNEVWHVGIGRWGACHQMGPRMWILTDFQDCEISQKSANSWILLTLRGLILHKLLEHNWTPHIIKVVSEALEHISIWAVQLCSSG